MQYGSGRFAITRRHARTVEAKGALMVSLGILLAILGLGSTARAELKVGDKAPDFTLSDQNGAAVHLADFRGKKTVVLAFYIRAFTPT